MVMLDRGASPLSHTSRPFDERIEDQTNEAFFREVASPPNTNRNNKNTTSRKTSKTKKNGKASRNMSATENGEVAAAAAEQRPTLQQMNEESLKKYQEFEKWQKMKQQEQEEEEQQQEQPTKHDNPKQQQEKKKKKQPQDKEDSPVPISPPPPPAHSASAQQRPSTITTTTATIRISELPEEKEECLSEDIYSLIYTANVCSQAFYFAIFVFAMQETLLLLILLDLVDVKWADDNTNQLRIPPGVPIRVNVAQAISIVLIVVTILGDSGDLTNGIGTLVAGYDRHVLSKNPHANCCKWFTAFTLQTLSGLSMTVVLFFLVMQSTTVIGLALNFAALTFIYEIDNLTFEMGKQGFLTRKIKATCERVKNHRVPKKQAMRQLRLRKVLVVLMLIGLFVPYGLLVHNQWDSQYLCSKVFIQFNGEAIPDIVYYTGSFKVHKQQNEVFGALRSRIDDRVYYCDETGSLILAYCEKEEAWTISLNSTDHCAYLYKSSSTLAFDVTDVASETWYAWDFKTRRSLPVHFYMTCNDCDDGARGNCHPNNGYCNDDNECICKENRLGRHCHDELPVCESLRIDTRTSALPFEQGVWFTDHYELLYIPGTNQVFQAQDRPVYVAYYYDTAVNGTSTGRAVIGTDFMFFNGRRWVILGKERSHLLADEINPWQRSRRVESSSSEDRDMEAMDALVELFGTEDGFSLKVLSIMFPLEEILNAVMGQNYTDRSLPLYRPYFYSQPVDPLSESDKLSPVGLSWYPAERPSNNILAQWRPDESRPLMSIFLCSECSDIRNPCLNAGVCNSDQVCECNAFFAGSMCERTVSCHEAGYCLNNGTCEEWNDFCTCSERYFGSLCQYGRIPTQDYVVEV